MVHVVDFNVLSTNPMAEIKFLHRKWVVSTKIIRLSKQWKYAIEIPLLGVAKAM
jgi:hypothetical protein